MLSAIERRTARAFLTNGHWFGGLPARLQRAFIDAAEKRRFSPRQIVQRQDESGRGFYMILQGQVAIADSFADGGRFLFHVGGPGFCFGEISTIYDSTAVEVTATTKVQALLVPASRLQAIFDEHPPLYRHFGALLAQRYRFALKSLSQSQVLSPEAFLRTRLADLCHLWRLDGYQEPVIELALSQAEIAHLVGISRQTLNRYVTRLEADGLIEVGFCSLRILEPDKLIAACSIQTLPRIRVPA